MNIVPQYEHSFLGSIMFKLCAGWTKFIVKHKFLYHFLTWTWGIIMSIVGLFTLLGLLIASIFNKDIKIKRYYWIFEATVGKNAWGGVSLGIVFLHDRYSSKDYMYPHEFGHAISQNSLLGPIAIFLCFIPSAIRYWYFEIRSRKGKTNKPYSAIWFEDGADMCGKYAVSALSKKS